MRDVNCYICESGDASLVVEQKFVDKYLSLIDPTYNSRARSLVVCDRCGLVYRRPQIDEADATSLYQHFRDSSVRTETPDEYFDRIAHSQRTRARITPSSLGSTVTSQTSLVPLGSGFSTSGVAEASSCTSS